MHSTPPLIPGKMAPVPMTTPCKNNKSGRSRITRFLSMDPLAFSPSP